MTEHHQLVPGQVPLAVWRDIYFGAGCSLASGAEPAVQAAAETVAAIIARGEPVYGINTGFGKLASVRIEDDDLAVLQRNIVLSHAAGVGEPLPVPVVRLIMALKIASLAQGFSGVRWQTITQLAICLELGLIPVIPGQGSVGASGDLAPLAHMSAVLMGVGAFLVDGTEVPAAQALSDAGLTPLELGPKEGLAFSTARRSRRHWRLPGCSRASACSRPHWSPGRSRPTRHAAPMAPSIRASTPCAAIAGRPRSPMPCAI